MVTSLERVYIFLALTVSSVWMMYREKQFKALLIKGEDTVFQQLFYDGINTGIKGKRVVSAMDI